MERDTKIAISSSLFGLGVGIVAGLRFGRQTAAPGSSGTCPIEKECGFGHWFAVMQNHGDATNPEYKVSYYVDAPFIAFLINWMGAKQYETSLTPYAIFVIEVDFPVTGKLRFQTAWGFAPLPKQDRGLYVLLDKPVSGAEKFFSNLTRAGLIREGGRYTVDDEGNIREGFNK